MPLLVYFYCKDALSRFLKQDLYLFVILELFLIYLTIMGVLNYDNRVTTLDDLYTFNLILPMILLGSSHDFWKDFIKFNFFFIFFALIINIISSVTISKSYHFQEDTIAELEDTGTVRLVRQILAYRTERSLATWPFLLLLLPKWNFKRSAITIALVLFVFGLQILFQKRGPIVRVMSYIGGFLILLPILLEQGQRIKIRFSQKVIFAFIAFAGVAVAVSYLPDGFLVNQVEGLIERFQGRRFNDQSYKGGALAVFTLENERIAEVFHMFHQLHFSEIVFGKGLGGTYFNTIEFNKQMAGTHMGIFSLVLKGGIFLFALYYYLMYRVFSNFKLYRQNYFAIACVIFLIVVNVFFWQEAFMFYSAQSLRLMLIGMCIGFLLSYKKRKLEGHLQLSPI